MLKFAWLFKSATVPCSGILLEPGVGLISCHFPTQLLGLFFKYLMISSTFISQAVWIYHNSAFSYNWWAHHTMHFCTFDHLAFTHSLPVTSPGMYGCQVNMKTKTRIQECPLGISPLPRSGPPGMLSCAWERVWASRAFLPYHSSLAIDAGSLRPGLGFWGPWTASVQKFCVCSARIPSAQEEKATYFIPRFRPGVGEPHCRPCWSESMRAAAV